MVERYWPNPGVDCLDCLGELRGPGRGALLGLELMAARSVEGRLRGFVATSRQELGEAVGFGKGQASRGIQELVMHGYAVELPAWEGDWRPGIYLTLKALVAPRDRLAEWVAFFVNQASSCALGWGAFDQVRRIGEPLGVEYDANVSALRYQCVERAGAYPVDTVVEKVWTRAASRYSVIATGQLPLPDQQNQGFNGGSEGFVLKPEVSIPHAGVSIPHPEGFILKPSRENRDTESSEGGCQGGEAHAVGWWARVRRALAGEGDA